MNVHIVLAEMPENPGVCYRHHNLEITIMPQTDEEKLDLDDIDPDILRRDCHARLILHFNKRNYLFVPEPNIS